jgi:N-acetylneuraminate synthase
MTHTIAGVTIGPDQPCRFVAEIGNAHNGSLDHALRLLDAAKAVGADLAKLQTYLPEELIALRGDGAVPPAWAAQGYTMRSLYEKAATPFAWLPALFTHARALGVPLFSSVFGARSLAALEAENCPAYKLAALDFEAAGLRWMVEEAGKPVIRSCPYEIAPAYDGVLLFAPPGYPQPAARLSRIRHGYQGYSYHGTDARVPVLAAAYGAHVIEVHFQLAGEPSELEDSVSLTDFEVAGAIRQIRHHERLAA